MSKWRWFSLCNRCHRTDQIGDELDTPANSVRYPTPAKNKNHCLCGKAKDQGWLPLGYLVVDEGKQ